METNLSHVIDLLPGLVWTALPDGRADFVNKRWRDYTGLGFDESRGPDWRSAVHPDDRASLSAGWRGLVTSGEPGELEAHVQAYQAMGFHEVHREDVLGGDQVREVLLQVGEGPNLVQLLEPLTPSIRPVARPIARRNY